jgi:hypothetical protein
VKEAIDKMLPIRIGAIVPKGGVQCARNCAPDTHSPEPHVLPRCRFMILVYMPMMQQAPSGATSFPFIGGPRTPPSEIGSIQMTGHPAVQHLVRFLNWN